MEKPIDLFKAIFETEDSDGDEDEQEDQQPRAEQAAPAPQNPEPQPSEGITLVQPLRACDLLSPAAASLFLLSCPE
jgi:FtsZ-interacting cell division protein YlmF